MDAFLQPLIIQGSIASIVLLIIFSSLWLSRKIRVEGEFKDLEKILDKKDQQIEVLTDLLSKSQEQQKSQQEKFQGALDLLEKRIGRRMP